MNMLKDGGARKKYIRDQIVNASPQRLVLLMYDGILRNIESARGQKDNPYQYDQHLVKAQAILAELAASIDRDINPEVSTNLLRLYDYAYQCLMDSNLKKDAALMTPAATILKDLRDTWASAIEKTEEDPSLLPKKEEAPLKTEPGRAQSSTKSFVLQA